MGRYDPTTTGALFARMRKTLGHLSRRDRETMLIAIDALLELTTRLHEATHVAPKPAGGLTVNVVAEDAAPLGYQGDIAVGQFFLWEKDKPTAWALIEVTKVEQPVGWSELAIWARVVRGTGVNQPDTEAFNDESRFREAVTPCDASGAETTKRAAEKVLD